MALPTDRELFAVAKKPLDCPTVDNPDHDTIFWKNPTECPLLNIDCKLFPDLTFDLTLGETETWRLSSHQAIHPYHIHVNPFTVCEEGGVRLDQPYWRDTLLIDNNKEGYEIRSRYLGFTGAFVMHCHRLNHEDQGMMSLVKIREPRSREERS